MKGSGRFYELVLGGLHKFEFSAFIFKKVGEEHPAVVMALAGGGSYVLNLLLDNLVLAVILAIALGAGAVLWKGQKAFRQPKHRSRRRRRHRRSRKEVGAPSPRRTGEEAQAPAPMRGGN